MSVVSEGSRAPDFTLVNQDGAKVGLETFAGKPVLIWWYPKADTPGCTIEGKTFRDHYADFQKRGIAVVGVSFDAPEANKKFKEGCVFPYDLLSDTDHAMSKAYGAATDESRTASRVSVLIGGDGNILKAYAKVSPADHPAEVLADYDKLK